MPHRDRPTGLRACVSISLGRHFEYEGGTGRTRGGLAEGSGTINVARTEDHPDSPRVKGRRLTAVGRSKVRFFRRGGAENFVESEGDIKVQLGALGGGRNQGRRFEEETSAGLAWARVSVRVVCEVVGPVVALVPVVALNVIECAGRDKLPGRYRKRERARAEGWGRGEGLGWKPRVGGRVGRPKAWGRTPGRRVSAATMWTAGDERL